MFFIPRFTWVLVHSARERAVLFLYEQGVMLILTGRSLLRRFFTSFEMTVFVLDEVIVRNKKPHHSD